MSDASEPTLTRAYELIEEDRLAEAEALLTPIVEREPDNVDAWWLYAHAVSDPETARMALNQVLRLDSSYEGAQELMDQLVTVYPATAVQDAQPVTSTPMMPPPTLPNLPEDEDMESPDFLLDMEAASVPVRESSGLDEDFSLDEVSDEDELPERRSRGRLPLIILGALLVVALITLIAVLNPFGSDTADTTPTAEVQQVAVPSPTTDTAGIAATDAEDAEPVMATPTPETADAAAPTTTEATEAEETGPVSEDEATVTEALSEFEVVEGTINTTETSLGSTLLVGVCTGSGAAMRDTLDQVMDALAGVSASTEAEAIGTILIDCENGTSTLRVIAVSAEDAAAYAAGELNEQDFQARWVAVA